MIQGANGKFELGLAALRRRRAAEAVVHFKAAMAAERQNPALRPQMKILSYYGLALALSGGSMREAVAACRRAVREEGFDADLYMNLGHVYLIAGKTSLALSTWERGLRVDRGHRRLKALIAREDRRATPVIPQLGRDHPINRSLGRFRSSFLRRGVAAS